MDWEMREGSCNTVCIYYYVKHGSNINVGVDFGITTLHERLCSGCSLADLETALAEEVCHLGIDAGISIPGHGESLALKLKGVSWEEIE